ncbi:MAG: hypothetical protein U1G07_20690 [Verrucomicrobiota bacterium]
MRHITRFGLLVATLLSAFTGQSHAVPIVWLDAPASVAPSETFQLGVFVTDLNDPTAVPVPDELLAFGFRLDPALFEPPGPAAFRFEGFTLGPGFNDDTDLVFAGVPYAVAGSAFPGINADPLLLAKVTLTTPSAASTGSWQVGFDPVVMQSHPSAGLFTLLLPGLVDPFIVTAQIGVRVPEHAQTWLLLAGSVAILLWASRGGGHRLGAAGLTLSRGGPRMAPGPHRRALARPG